MPADHHAPGLDQLLDSPDLAVALESDRFKQFLDQVPVAIAVSELEPRERIVYANLEFERLTGQNAATIVGGRWDALPGRPVALADPRPLGEVLAAERDYVGSYVLPRDGDPLTVDAWSNVIDDDAGAAVYRLVALVEAPVPAASVLDHLQEQVLEKDIQLKELQHRVKNNLQMITALIRMEAKGVADRTTGEGFDRLAGRVEALGLLYRSLGQGSGDAVDLGVYLSEIASAVMRAHAVEGIRLDLKVDVWPVSLDVAMPTGLVVNELLTNALKHAFVDREGGTITVHCLCDISGCTVVVADDGVGLPPDCTWPKPGKLSALIVRSLQQNAKAMIDVRSVPGQGVRVTITFDCEDADPAA